MRLQTQLVLAKTVNQERASQIREFCISFALVALTFPIWPSVPPLNILSIIICLGFLCYRQQGRVAYIGMSIGIIFFTYHAMQWRTIQQDIIVQPEYQVTAKVISQQSMPRYHRLLLQVKSPKALSGKRIRVNDYDNSKDYFSGQIWTLNVKLKATHTWGNPAGFDYQRYLLGEGIVASGYVRQAKLINQQTNLRHKAYQSILAHGVSEKSWLPALMLGLKPDAPATRDILVQSGTIHLMVISGLHFAIVISLLYWLSQRLLRCSNYRISQILTTVFILIACGIYLLLVGAHSPAQRAFIALFIVLLCLLCRLRISYFDGLLWVFLCLCISEPFRLMQTSLYLTFGALLSIAITVWWLPKLGTHPLSKVRYFLQFQLLFTFLFMPITLYLIGYVQPFAWLWNAFLVPIITLFFVPVCFLTLALVIVHANYISLSWLLSPLLQTLDSFLNAIILGLGAVITPVMTLEIHVPILGLLMLSSFVIGNALISRYWRIGWVIMVAVLLIYLNQPQRTMTPRFVVFSVGQGSMALYHDEQHALLFDTGIGKSERFNSPQLVLVDYLKANGIEKIDAVYISHFDADHSGGLPYAKALWPGAAIISPKNNCYTGYQRSNSTVDLDVIWPPPDFVGSKNDRSCVIVLSVNSVRILLPGDISKKIEHQLVTQKLAPVDILIAAHHGSKSSSSDPFLSALQPSHVVFSSGFQHHWNMPHPDVLTRVQGKNIYQTRYDGAIIIDFLPSDAFDVRTFKRDIAPRWYHHFTPAGFSLKPMTGTITSTNN